MNTAGSSSGLISASAQQPLATSFFTEWLNFISTIGFVVHTS
jgi:hypothetical protein